MHACTDPHDCVNNIVRVVKCDACLAVALCEECYVLHLVNPLMQML